MSVRQRATSRARARVVRALTARGTVARLSVEEKGLAGRSGAAPVARPAPTGHEQAAERAAERAAGEGRREQRCPCGREEAGGFYCTGCLAPVHPDEWTAAGRTDAQIAAVAATHAARRRSA